MVIVRNAFLNASSLASSGIVGLNLSIAFSNAVVKPLRYNLFPFYRLRQYQDHTTPYILNLH
jgi:hypothetical protein